MITLSTRDLRVKLLVKYLTICEVLIIPSKYFHKVKAMKAVLAAY